jgi:hypothetical protein
MRFRTLTRQPIEWRHNVAFGGGITLYWVAELIVFSKEAGNNTAVHAKAIRRQKLRRFRKTSDDTTAFIYRYLSFKSHLSNA